MAELHVELVAANGKLWEGEARLVSARGTEGEFGVMPGHVPMLTALREGEVHIEGTDGDKRVKVEGGFMSVDHDKVTIVTDSAQVEA